MADALALFATIAHMYLENCDPLSMLGEFDMNGISTRSTMATTVIDSRRRRANFYLTGFLIRLAIALMISWLIIMAFFVTNVASH